jgi:glucose/arabinose dehydrogenase
LPRTTATAPARLAPGFAIVVIVAACGGGGSANDTPTAPPGPAVILTSPADLADGLVGTLAIAATASADAGVAAVEFQVDGATVGAEDTSPPYGTSIDTSAYADGQHVVRARARDAAGNVSPWAGATVRFGGVARMAAGFTKTEDWIAGLASATAFAQAPDGRLFVCEQGGTLRVVKNGRLLPTPFHAFAVDPSGERGLLGVAFDPDFANNRFVYAYHTTTQNGTHNRISRLVAGIANGDVSDGTEQPLVDLPRLSAATNHNGGAIHFGADGKLYAGVGDNANGAQSQDVNNPLGKLLRFNADGSIPADNPFGATNPVWAYGLRNPYTFAVEPGTGRMFIDDVGEATWEEIDLATRGANYGWPGSEGPDRVTAGITGPLFAYGHGTPDPSGPGGFFTGIAITGGAFYPAAGPFPAAYRGSYFFADLGSKFVARLDTGNGNAAYAFASIDDAPVSMLVGADGALYVLARGSITRISSP